MSLKKLCFYQLTTLDLKNYQNMVIKERFTKLNKISKLNKDYLDKFEIKIKRKINLTKIVIKYLSLLIKFDSLSIEYLLLSLMFCFELSFYNL